MLPAIADMPRLTTADLLADFDAILARVEHGACFVITCDNGGDVVLLPYDAYTTLLDQADVASSSKTSTAEAPSP